MENIPVNLPFVPKPVLEDREAVANCLPPLVYMDTLVYPISGDPPFRVDDRLAQLRARVIDGKLTTWSGKVLYTKPADSSSETSVVDVGMALLIFYGRILPSKEADYIDRNAEYEIFANANLTAGERVERDTDPNVEPPTLRIVRKSRN
jgi:hypothetical protein